MNILFVTHPYPNYVPDLLLHGLSKLLGASVVDYPRKDCVYEGVLGLGICPEDQRCPGWFPNDDGLIDRTDFEEELNEMSAINAKKYDLVLAGSTWCRDRMLEKGILNCDVLILGNALQDPELLSSPLILLDTEHDGAFENQVYAFLKQNHYQGLLVLDDIYLNEAMKQFWHAIDVPKEDLTDIGHWSGTGIVDFG